MALSDETRDYRKNGDEEKNTALFFDSSTMSFNSLFNRDYYITVGKKDIIAQISENIAQLPTQVNLKAVKPLPSLRLIKKVILLNDTPIDQQTTSIIPVIQASDRAQKSEAKNSEVGDYITNLRKLIKSAGFYALASLASPLIALLLAPFLAHNLSRPEYGVLAVLTTAIALTAGITQLGLGSAFFRTYNYDYETQRDKSGVLSTTIILLSLVSIPATIATIIAAPWLAILLFKSSLFGDLVKLASLVVLLQNLTVPGFAWMRAENRAIFFSLLSIFNLLITLVATIVLVGILHLGIAGSLIATGIGYAVVVISTLLPALFYAGVRLRFNIAWSLLAFGVPNVANYVSVWILQLSDRYLLSHLGSLTQTATYAIAYSLGGGVSALIIAPFSLAWPSTMYAIAKRDDAANIFRLVFRWYVLAMLFAVFSFSLICTDILNLFFPPTYHSAAPIIPIIGASVVFDGAYIVLTVGISIRRKTWFAVGFTAISALINVGLNLVLIPLYGSMGAAISTLLAYTVLSLIAYIVNQRIYPIPFEIGIFVSAFLVGFALYIGSSLLAQTYKAYLAWGIYICALSLYGGGLALLGKLPIKSIYKHKLISAGKNTY